MSDLEANRVAVDDGDCLQDRTARNTQDWSGQGAQVR